MIFSSPPQYGLYTVNLDTRLCIGAPTDRQ